MTNDEIFNRTDPRPALGVDLLLPGGPFRLVGAQRATPNQGGGSLDLGIIATLPDGREVVVGELWAMGPEVKGRERLSIDPVETARALGLDPGSCGAFDSTAESRAAGYLDRIHTGDGS